MYQNHSSVPMDLSQFILDPALWFDPNLPHLTDFPPTPGADSSSISNGLLSRRKTRIRASRACIACRSRHMKCDSVEPKCTRCQIDSRTCVYTKSRRGGSSKSAIPPEELQSLVNGPTTSTAPQSSTASPRGPDSIFSDITLIDTVCSEVSSVRQTEAYRLIDSYYEFFHNAHPIALPRKKLLHRLNTDPGSLEYLTPVLEYIGAIYTPDVNSVTLRQLAHERLYSNDLPSTPFSVQALVLFSLAIHCSDEYKAAESHLNRAVDIALSINMHHGSFACNNSEGDPILAESWRRTWYTLYGADGLFAAIGHYPSHRLQDTIGDVKLPCEDREYESGVSRFLVAYALF
jgi:hypothetical protein